MAISKKDVKEWLARKLPDSAKTKRVPIERIKRRVMKLKPKPRFHTEPRDHQWRCFWLGTKYDGYVYLLDMGLGKTKLMLDLIRWRIDAGHIDAAMVLVPGVSNVGEWVDEARTHQPKLKVLGLDATTYGKREELLETPHHVLVLTYAGLQKLVCVKPMESKKPARGKKKALVPVPELLSDFAEFYGLTVCDESTDIKNHNALPTQIVKGLSKAGSAVYCLTGTPIDKSPEDFWSQFYVVDGGSTLGRHLNIFRAAFFTATPARFHAGFTYEFRPSKLKKLSRILRARSIRYDLDECADIPKAVTKEVPVLLPRQNWAYYEKLLDEFEAANGDRDIIQNTYLRMRQLAAGYLRALDSDEVVVFRENPKLDALVDKLREIPEDEKVVVFCHYKQTGQLISECLEKANISNVRLYGKTRDKASVARNWKTSKTRVIVCSKTGSKGLNLQVARYMITVEAFDSAIDYEQSRRRIRRMGQERVCVYYDIVARGTIDEKIRRAVSEGRNLLEELVDGKVSLR